MQKIILDNKINMKDIPEIIRLLNNAYSKINNIKKLHISIEKYELVKTLLHICFIIYITQTKVDNSELLLNLLYIIDVGIDLIKLTPVKNNCFNCLF